MKPREYTLEKQNFCCCCLWPMVDRSSYLQTDALVHGCMPLEAAVRCTCPDILAASQLALNWIRYSLLYASRCCFHVDCNWVDSSWKPTDFSNIMHQLFFTYILILPIAAIPHYCHTHTHQNLTQGGSGEKRKRRAKVFRINIVHTKCHLFSLWKAHSRLEIKSPAIWIMNMICDF